MRDLTSHAMLLGDFEKRKIRWKRRFGTLKVDFANELSWSLSGGHRIFDRFWRELAGSHRWIFIIGCNNSGTSLLQRLLDWTGQISTFPLEGQLYTRALKRDRNPKFSRVWTEYLDELQLRPGQSLERCPRLVHDWMINLPRPLQHIIVEKTPANTSRAEWLQEVFPDSRFIGLVRNGYAVTEGINRKARQPYARGARHWNMVNKLMVNTARNLDHYIEVRYENLAEKPASTMLEICRFVGLQNDLIEELARSNEEEAAKLMVTKFGPVRNHDEETIRKLGTQNIVTIREQAAEMLEHFDY